MANRKDAQRTQTGLLWPPLRAAKRRRTRGYSATVPSASSCSARRWEAAGAREPWLSCATSFASAGCAPRPLSAMQRLPLGLGAGGRSSRSPCSAPPPYRRQVGRGRGRRRRAQRQTLQPSSSCWTSLTLRGPACCRSERERSVSAASSRLKTVPSGRRKKGAGKKKSVFHPSKPAKPQSRMMGYHTSERPQSLKTVAQITNDTLARKKKMSSKSSYAERAI